MTSLLVRFLMSFGDAVALMIIRSGSLDIYALLRYHPSLE
jgi:hypothetical protein